MISLGSSKPDLYYAVFLIPRLRWDIVRLCVKSNYGVEVGWEDGKNNLTLKLGNF